ncbi:DUF1080 domain-containing protein [Robertkochia marina]|uniref:DUF1080 domain-containing protein n=1 Tax=Robertkochia marina TaxID=1227945 RepID=A0A4S3M2K9_9FLAO|nr:DUF1080 domain-containing protein [Robertkochia marina]THD69100.1 DUF1080 domain-containing protein [Robertkochia marina]TRZ44924.1 DUF1080 domain-containing protein [Robertkochia marina]
MRKLALTFMALTLLNACKEEKKDTNPELTAAEEVNPHKESQMKEDWIVLFDGTSTDAWHEYGKDKDSFPESWKIEDNALTFYPAEGEKHNIVTDQEFESFELHIEWKISEGGNSGIMWGVQEMEQYNEPYFTGPEIQVLDNLRHPDAKIKGKTHQAGALYDMVEPSEDVTSPVGEWNTFVIRIDHKANQGSVIHNGVLITEFPVHGEAWNTMVKDSKFANWKDFGQFPKGKIALQDHSDKVSYRNIKIKKL